MSDSESSLIDNATHPTSLRLFDGVIANDGRPSVTGITVGNIGMLFIISAQFFSACMYISVKILNDLEPQVHALQVSCFFTSGRRIVEPGITGHYNQDGHHVHLLRDYTCPTITRIPDPIAGPKAARTLLVVRGISGFFGMCGVYWSLQYLTVADATVLLFLTPLMTAVAGSIFLKESYSINQAVAGICSLLGVILISRPPFLFGPNPVIPNGRHLPEGTPAERLGAVGACMISVLGLTGAYISMRAIGTRANPMHVMLYFSLLCTIIASLGMIVFDIPVVFPTFWTWLLLLMIGSFGFVTQTLLTLGLQRETASRGVTGIYAQVIFAVVLERLFFGITPSVLSTLGAAIIMSSALYVVLRKRDPTKDSTSDNSA
ncbi:drug/metabolite transporter superfamily [Suillus lakei]|nr:drug/metabolite transporter superfamily [Suillus lakei]